MANSQNVLKGIAYGTVAGLLASWAMEKSQYGLSGLQSRFGKRQEKQIDRGTKKPGRHEDPATVKMASRITKMILHHAIKPKQKKFAGELVHYAMGAATGAVFGGLNELVPSIRLGAGTLYGLAVWLVADEAMVPAFGLSKAPTKYPPSVHLYALASHLVYGSALNAATQGLRKVA